jgi:carboxypeptidase C (cathepsin A)
MGLFAIHGPVRFNKQGKVQPNPHGWHEAANILYLESPSGVGFSHAADPNDIPRQIEVIGEQFWRFSQEFCKVFPQGKAFKWWITGESFGGMYVPHIAQAILQHNQHLKLAETRIQLGGVAIGNGIFYSAFDGPVGWVSYFTKLKLWKDAELQAAISKDAATCGSEMVSEQGYKKRNAPHCEKLLQIFPNPQFIHQATGGKHCLPSFYDVRLRKCGQPDPNNALKEHIEKYLNRPDVQQAMHASLTPVSWKMVNQQVYRNLFFNGDQPSAEILPQLIHAGVPMLLYNGDQDVICNYVGTERTLHGMTWQGATGFGKSKFTKVRVEPGDAPYGQKISARGLTYVRVYNAGHMAPMDQPSGSLHMIQGFLKTHGRKQKETKPPVPPQEERGKHGKRKGHGEKKKRHPCT